jgi:hypothetical protein
MDSGKITDLISVFKKPGLQGMEGKDVYIGEVILLKPNIFF